MARHSWSIVAYVGAVVAAATASMLLGGCPAAAPGGSPDPNPITSGTTIETTPATEESEPNAQSEAPAADAILVSIVMHFEEPPGYPNFENDQAAFQQYRAALVEFAGVLSEREVQFDFQSDWNFLKAVAKWDAGTPETGGKNVVLWLHEDLGFDIDPHAHETLYNYADVAYLIEQLGVSPTAVVGGFIADPPRDSLLEYFWQPIAGLQYPGYIWTPALLWGGGTGNHVNDELLWTSGIWRPADRGQFLTHDESAPLPNIGNFGGTWENLDLLLALREAGQLSSGIHTCTIMTNGRDIVEPGFIEELAAALAERAEGAGIRWVTLSQVLQIWLEEYGGEANQLTYSDAAALVQ